MATRSIDTIVTDKKGKIDDMLKVVAVTSTRLLISGVVAFIISCALMFYVITLVDKNVRIIEDIKGIYYGLTAVSALAFLVTIMIFRRFSSCAVQQSALYKELLNLDDLRAAVVATGGLNGATGDRATQEIINTLLTKCE